MTLAPIQRALERLYDVELGACIDDFLCDEETARASIGEGVERGEVLLVREDSDGVALGLYVDPRAVACLAADGDAWLDGRFGPSCLATEGVSHFVYLLFRAQQGDAVTQLELELQAEIDKWAHATGIRESRRGAELLEGNGAGLIRLRSRALRTRLFDHVAFLDDEGSEEGERYRVANRLAARYTGSLEERFLARGDVPGALRELRRFYRLGAREKLELAGR